MKNASRFLVLLLLAGLCVSAFAQATDQPPQISGKVDPTVERPGVSSALDVIPISNPYAAAGQPVIINFTLSNVGKEYPFNQIPLPPDQYVLVMAADKEMGVTLADGTNVDVWQDMDGIQRVTVLMSLGTKQAIELIGKGIEGRQCGYVDEWDVLPVSIRQSIIAKNGGKSIDHLYSWECIKLVDKPFFDKSIVKNYCKNGTVDSKCISALNKDFANSIGGTVYALLSSDPQLGQCVRPTDDAFKNGDVLGGLASVLTGNANVVACGIGKDGLKPDSSVTMQFVGIVPADAPVIPPEDFIQGQSANVAVTKSASCLDSDQPKNCHTIYAAVFPAQQKGLVQVLGAATIDNLAAGLGGTASAVLTLNLQNFENYVRTNFQHTGVVGDPIWQGAGTFYLVGAQLQGSITLILWLAFIAGVGVTRIGA